MTEQTPIRVVLVDDHAMFRTGVRAELRDSVEIVDGQGRRASATIAAITDEATTLDVAAPTTIVDPTPHVRALLPLVKGDRMDYAIEKLVEVGVDSIVLWPAARAVVKLDADRREGRIAKLAAQLQAAARQSGRARVPSISYATTLGLAIEALPHDVVVNPGRGREVGENPRPAVARAAVDHEVPRHDRRARRARADEDAATAHRATARIKESC